MTSKHSRYFVTPLSAERGASGQTQRRYHYHDIAPPAGVPQKATVLLLHGFPDTAAGWFRITSPLSMSGYRLLIPDCLGYGLTSKPDLATRLHEYSFKSMVHDLCDLLDHAKAGQGALYGSDTVEAATGKNGRVIVVGHDWGAVLAWNFARFRIDRMLGVAALAVPYPAPTSKYIDINDLVKLVPSFGYQAFFAEPRSTALIEKNVSAARVQLECSRCLRNRSLILRTNIFPRPAGSLPRRRLLRARTLQPERQGGRSTRADHQHRVGHRRQAREAAHRQPRAAADGRPAAE